MSKRPYPNINNTSSKYMKDYNGKKGTFSRTSNPFGSNTIKKGLKMTLENEKKNLISKSITISRDMRIDTDTKKKMLEDLNYKIKQVQDQLTKFGTLDAGTTDYLLSFNSFMRNFLETDKGQDGNIISACGMNPLVFLGSSPGNTLFNTYAESQKILNPVPYWYKDQSGQTRTLITREPILIDNSNPNGAEYYVINNVASVSQINQSVTVTEIHYPAGFDEAINSGCVKYLVTKHLNKMEHASLVLYVSKDCKAVPNLAGTFFSIGITVGKSDGKHILVISSQDWAHRYHNIASISGQGFGSAQPYGVKHMGPYTRARWEQLKNNIRDTAKKARMSHCTTSTKEQETQGDIQAFAPGIEIDTNMIYALHGVKGPQELGGDNCSSWAMKMINSEYNQPVTDSVVDFLVGKGRLRKLAFGIAEQPGYPSFFTTTKKGLIEITCTWNENKDGIDTIIRDEVMNMNDPESLYIDIPAAQCTFDTEMLNPVIPDTWKFLYSTSGLEGWMIEAKRIADINCTKYINPTYVRAYLGAEPFDPQVLDGCLNRPKARARRTVFSTTAAAPAPSAAAATGFGFSPTLGATPSGTRGGTSKRRKHSRKGRVRTCRRRRVRKNADGSSNKKDIKHNKKCSKTKRKKKTYRRNNYKSKKRIRKRR